MKILTGSGAHSITHTPSTPSPLNQRNCRVLYSSPPDKVRKASQLKPCSPSCLFPCLTWEHLANHFPLEQLRNTLYLEKSKTKGPRIPATQPWENPGASPDGSSDHNSLPHETLRPHVSQRRPEGQEDLPKDTGPSWSWHSLNPDLV